MTLAIVITFQYLINQLPGALLDLQCAYNWCNGFTNNVVVLTDIRSDDIANKILVNNAVQLLTALDRTLEQHKEQRIIIYYSGHGVRDNMLMPDQTVLPFIEFRDCITNSAPLYSEIFFILDCCNPNGLHLPYKLHNNHFVLSSAKVECVTQPIILITSSDAHEKSVTTKTGSIFSNLLFSMLSEMNQRKDVIVRDTRTIVPSIINRNLQRLSDSLTNNMRKMETGYDQTVSIYSSYVIDPVLWLWIGSTASYDIAIDKSLSTFVVRSLNSEPV
jgi:hypothetical protein